MAKSKVAASPAAPKARTRTTTKKVVIGPTQQDIALRAYHIFLERKGAPGDPNADWIRAERELLEVALREKPKSTRARKTKDTKVTAINADRSAA